MSSIILTQQRSGGDAILAFQFPLELFLTQPATEVLTLPARAGSIANYIELTVSVEVDLLG